MTVLDRMIETLNTNDECKAIMNELSEKAKEKHLSQAQWEHFKKRLLFDLYVKVATEHKDVMDEIAIEYLKEYSSLINH